MPTKLPPRKPKPKQKRTGPIVSDFGAYLKSLRVSNGITLKKVAESLNLSVRTVGNTEMGYNKPPNAERLKLWLSAIGETSKYGEALRLLKAVKTYRTIGYRTGDHSNEHIDRLLDAYEQGRLTETDQSLIKMIAPHIYTT